MPTGTRSELVRRADRHTPLFGALDDLQGMRVLEQRLGGNASPQQARPAEGLLLLDDRDLESELSGSNRGDVAACPRTDHDDVVLVRHSWIDLFLQGGQRDKGRGRGLHAGRPRVRLRLTLEPADTRTQLAILVAQLPIRFGEAVEPPGHLPCPREGSKSDDECRAGRQPL